MYCCYCRVASNLPAGQLSNVPWRKAGVKYASNEAFFDVIEEIDAIIDKSGGLVTCEVQGYVSRPFSLMLWGDNYKYNLLHTAMASSEIVWAAQHFEFHWNIFRSTDISCLDKFSTLENLQFKSWLLVTMFSFSYGVVVSILISLTCEDNF